MVNSDPISVLFFENVSVAPVKGFALAFNFLRKVKITCHECHISTYVHLWVFPMTEMPRHFPLVVFVLI